MGENSGSESEDEIEVTEAPKEVPGLVPVEVFKAKSLVLESTFSKFKDKKWLIEYQRLSMTDKILFMNTWEYSYVQPEDEIQSRKCRIFLASAFRKASQAVNGTTKSSFVVNNLNKQIIGKYFERFAGVGVDITMMSTNSVVAEFYVVKDKFDAVVKCVDDNIGKLFVEKGSEEWADIKTNELGIKIKGSTDSNKGRVKQWLKGEVNINPGRDLIENKFFREKQFSVKVLLGQTARTQVGIVKLMKESINVDLPIGIFKARDVLTFQFARKGQMLAAKECIRKSIVEEEYIII